MTALRAALSESSLRRALLAFLAFGVAEEGVWLAVLLYAFDVGGATAAGVVAVAQLVPAMLLVPITSTLIDRMSVRAGLVLAYGCSGVATLAIGVLLLLQAPTWAVVLSAVVQSCAVTMSRPAHYAALPRLAELPTHLVAANAVTGSVEALGVLLGPLSVAVALTFSGVAPLVVALAALLVIGALLVGTARVPQGASRVDHDDGSRAGGETERERVPEPFVRSATMGLREVRRIPGAFSLLVMVGMVWVLQGALDVLGVSFAIEVLEAGERGAGVLAAGNGLGLLLGSALAVVLVGVARMSPVFVAGAVVGGLALAAVGLTSTLVVAVVLLAVSGAARSFVDVAGRTLLHRNADDRAMARVFGVQEAVLVGGLAVGAAVAPVMIALLGESAAFVLTGALLVVPALLALPSLAGLDRTGVLAAHRIRLLRSLSLFAPLPAPDLERLALVSDRCKAATGEQLIEQGAVGDCFYAVESGRYEVVKDGASVALLGPGDYFGEIALLRDVPRTASVTCVEEGELVVLDREPFVTAMSRTRPPRESA